MYEKQHLPEDFHPENLNVFINNETFFETKHFINSAWLDYHIKKYNIENYLNEIMKLAINQEDLDAVNVMLKNNFIVSKNEVDLAENIKKNQHFDIEKNKEQGYDSYIVSESKIDKILEILTKKYNSHRIYDKDGYSNLREGRSTDSKIITKIKSGERIKVIGNIEEDVTEDKKGWCYVETKEGKKGYVHKSRIKSE